MILLAKRHYFKVTTTVVALVLIAGAILYFKSPVVSPPLEAVLVQDSGALAEEKTVEEGEIVSAVEIIKDEPLEEPALNLPTSIEPVLVSVATTVPALEREPAAKQDTIELLVPFSSQAPRFNWKDSRQQDGCEEVSALMAMFFVRDEPGPSPAKWEEEIIALADFEQEKYGEHRDVSAEDVILWIFNDYFSYDQVRLKEIKTVTDILEELEVGNLVLAPTNGQALDNPNFTPPGPTHHFLVIKGYDYLTKEFITNDPGTRLGKGYRYPEKKLIAALRAYPTGYHDRYEDERKTAIIVEK